MKFAWHVVVPLIGLVSRCLGGMGLEARLSLHFSELSVAEDGCVRAKVRDWGLPEHVGINESRQIRQAEKGEVVCVPRGGKLFFHHGGPRQTLFNLDANSDLWSRVQVPKELKGESTVLAFRFTDDTYLVAPQSGKACRVGDEGVFELHFPFRCIWKSEDEERAWFNARADDSRAAAIEAEGVRARDSAKILYRDLLADSHAAEVLQKSTAVTNVTLKIRNRDDIQMLTMDIRPYDGPGGKVVLLKYWKVESPDLLVQDVFDGHGRVRWSVQSELKDVGPRRKKGTVAKAFEFDADGELSRSWTRDSAQILLGHGSRRRSPADAADPRRFFDDLWRVVTQ